VVKGTVPPTNRRTSTTPRPTAHLNLKYLPYLSVPKTLTPKRKDRGNPRGSGSRGGKGVYPV